MGEILPAQLRKFDSRTAAHLPREIWGSVFIVLERDAPSVIFPEMKRWKVLVDGTIISILENDVLERSEVISETR